MPRRLLLAAEIVLDVAGALPGVDRSGLEAMAEELRAGARRLAEAQGVPLDDPPGMERLRPSIRRIAAALDPEVDYRRDPLAN